MKTIIALLLLSILMPVSADKLDDCTIASTFAETTMRLRQDNIEMSKMINILQKFDADTRLIAESIIKDAYDQPAYDSGKYKLRAIKKFKNDVFRECYK